jgi:hypothetical protein
VIAGRTITDWAPELLIYWRLKSSFTRAFLHTNRTLLIDAIRKVFRIIVKDFRASYLIVFGVEVDVADTREVGTQRMRNTVTK